MAHAAGDRLATSTTIMREMEVMEEHVDGERTLLPPPEEVYTVVASFLPDPRTVGRCALTCKAFNKAIRGNEEELWQNLADVRWKIAPVRKLYDGFSFRLEYKQRHKLDALLFNLMVSMGRRMMDQNVLVKSFCYNWHWGDNQIAWVLFSELAVRQHRCPAHMLDGLKRLATTTTAYNDTFRATMLTSLQFKARRINVSDDDAIAAADSTRSGKLDDVERLVVITQCLACHVLDVIYFHQVQRDWRSMTTRMSSPDDVSLEEGVAAIARSLAGYEDLLNVNDDHYYNLAEYVREQLDRYGSQLQSRLLQERGAFFSDLEATQTLIAMMVDELGFSGNAEDYYNMSNSSIFHVLKTRKGIPITLAVVCKLIMQRVNVTANVVGLPGHVVLGLADRVTYFDVFHGGRLLTADDCMLLVPPGHPWSDDFLEPMTPISVLRRMIRNIQNGLHEEIPRQRSVRTKIHLERIQLLFDSITVPPFGATDLAALTLDPATFARYELIGIDMVRPARGW